MANRPVGNGNNRSARFRKIQRNKPQIKPKNGIVKRCIIKTNKVQDARQKILQKKRRTVVDARDVLAKLTKAKTQDARSKINKIRENRNGIPTSSGQFKVISNNILRKTDRNGKISLVTNKTRSISEINLAIQKELGLLQNAIAPVRPKKIQLKRNNTPNQMSIRKTIVNDLDYPVPVDPMVRMYDPSLYKWPTTHTAASQLINSIDAARRNTLIDNGWNNYTVSKPMGMNNYVDLDTIDDEEMPLASARQTISIPPTMRVSNIHSRLDTKMSQQESQGILSQTKTKVVVPVGHRIVVSNLQPTVTQDDIKELFEDIGQLLTARLVRPGVAEVIYKNLKDAQKAVDTYHNRQLDGQPMKCLLVNKRPINQPTAPAINKSDSQSVLLRKQTTDHSLVPDISTIHKVLFQRK